ncbi:MAG: sporulation integral membrane protein YtvI [Firmicutes bacterium]|nr:sporulation integral membrane protein YtvI [Bacillota bacterium]
MLPGWYRRALNTIVLTGAGLLILLATVAAIWLSKYIFPAVLPFIVAMFVSFMIEPMINALQQRFKLSRALATGFSMLVVFGGLGTILVLLIIQLVAELISLSASLPEITREVRHYIEQLIPVVMRFYGDLPMEVVSYLQEAIRDLGRMLQSLVEVAATSLLAFLSLVPGTVVLVIVTLLATYFITKDRRAIGNFWRRLLPSPYGDKSINVINHVLQAFWSYLKAQSILVTITMIISTIGFYMVGAEYAITLGLLVGLFDIIPVLGPATVFIPLVLWFILVGNIGISIKLTILYIIILVVRQLLEARVVAANLGLHPLATLMAMYAGLKLIGFTGLIIGPILLIAIQASLKAGNFLKR